MFIDNLLYFEVSGGGVTKKFLVGCLEAPARFGSGGPIVDYIGTPQLSHSAKEIELTPNLPKDVWFDIKVTFLDYGGNAGLSDIYLWIETPKGK